MPKAQANAKKAEMKVGEKNLAARGVNKPKHKPKIDQIQAENTAKFLADQQAKSADEGGVDTGTAAAVQSGYSIFNQPTRHDMTEETKTKKTAEEKAAAKAEREAKAQAKAQAKAAEAEAKAKAKVEREAAKAAADEAKAKAKAEREAAAAQRKAEREANGDAGKMAALRAAKDRYVKSATGRLRSSDEVALLFDAVEPARVIGIAMQALALTANPYAHLNVGQQSMNLRNKIRGAIRKGVLTAAQVAAIRDAV